MAIMSLTYRSQNPTASGWLYLWAKVVRGANLDRHCAKCLVGPYVRQVKAHMPSFDPIGVEVPDDGFLYVCGVSRPYRWENNLHGALRPGNGQVELFGYNGDSIAIDHAEVYQFNGIAAQELFPGRGPEFLTCRNFQFAVQAYGRYPR